MDKFKNKPSPELLAHYINRLEYFLSAHNLSISITLQNRALFMRHTRDGHDAGTTSFWLDHMEVSTNYAKALPLEWYGWGIEEGMTDREIWGHAWHLQQALYQKLGLNPKDMNDPLYRLWDKYREIGKAE